MPSLHRFLLIALIVLLPMANPVKAADAGIASVIESQLNAFRSDDIAGAYSHAAPNIRQMFPTISATYPRPCISAPEHPANAEVRCKYVAS